MSIPQEPWRRLPGCRSRRTRRSVRVPATCASPAQAVRAGFWGRPRPGRAYALRGKEDGLPVAFQRPGVVSCQEKPHHEENPRVRRGLTREAMRRAPSEHRPLETHGTVRIGRLRFHEPANAGAGLATLTAARTCSVCRLGAPGESPLDTHGRVVDQRERLGRALSDLLPARLAFVTRDLAVLVVSTGASRRHRLSFIGAVRGRTLRWFRHGSLPCYARVSITSRAPELGPPTFPSPGC
jgi:hypothetical protein